MMIEHALCLGRGSRADTSWAKMDRIAFRKTPSAAWRRVGAAVLVVGAAHDHLQHQLVERPSPSTTTLRSLTVRSFHPPNVSPSLIHLPLA